MAGIGFVLRKLLEKDNLGGIIKAYLHATAASSGPWLFTVVALGTFFLIVGNYIEREIIETFRVIILYNFAFSLVVSAPITIVSTRFLADLIYSKNVQDAPGMMLGMMMLQNSIVLPLGIGFYFCCTNMETITVLLAVVNFILITNIWLISIFISALKQYTGVTFSFIVGLIIAVFTGMYLSDVYTENGMLVGFNIGLAFIFASLVALVFAEYPKKCTHLFRVIPYFTRYWELALGAFAYSLGIWVDKWIMWFSPEATILPNSMIMYPHYDGAMFIAYLTVVPIMAMFLISQETAFFEQYVKFYQDIQQHASYKKIENNHEQLVACILTTGKRLIFFQGCIALAAILVAPKIFDFLEMNFIQLGIFRFGVLGAAFQVQVLFMTVFLSYFDYRKGVLIIQVFFLLANGSLTLITKNLGFAYYGYGYFLASVLTLVLAATLMERYVRKLPYYAFVVNNTSVQENTL